MPKRNNELQDAVIAEDLKKISELLAAGKDANGDDEGSTCPPIIFAAEKGSLEVTKLLVEAGADMERVSDDDYIGKDAAFYTSLEHGHQDVATFLLDQGANPFGVADDEDDYEVYGEVRIATTLSQAIGQHFNALAKKMIPLMLAKHPRALEAVYGDDEEISALMFAADSGNLEMVKYLIEINQGVDDRCTTSEGLTALHYALGGSSDQKLVGDPVLQANSLSIVKALVNAGLSLDVEDANGVRPRDLGDDDAQTYFNSL